MAGKYSWIALFVVLQISTVLCRSTEKPNDEVNLALVGHKLSPQGQASLSKNGEDPTPESPLPSKMSYDPYIDREIYVTYNTMLTAYAIVGITIGVFSIVSLILGCIMFACCKKEPKRGFVVNNNAGGQIGTTAPEDTGAVRPMQQHPPPYGHVQQQNAYPTKY